MPTLSQATSITKKVAIFGGGGILLAILLFFLSKGAISLYSSLFPKPGPAPEAAFNALPPLVFPESVTQEKFKYSLDTVSGNLGEFPDRLKVYKTVVSEPNLLSLQSTQSLVAKTSFTFNRTKLNDTTYAWNEVVRPEKRLTVNIVSKDFSIDSNFLTYPDLAANGRVNEENAKNEVTEFLSLLGLFPSDIDILQTNVDLLKLEDEKLVAALTPSDAQIARIDLYQSDLDKFQIVYPNPPHTTMHFIVGGANTRELMEASFNHQAISNESSTYPLISVNDAYSLLKKNGAYVGSYFGSSTDIVIKKVYLGYYLGVAKQEYVMPVFVFEGKDGFSAYVSAVKSEWINKAN